MLCLYAVPKTRANLAVEQTGMSLQAWNIPFPTPAGRGASYQQRSPTGMPGFQRSPLLWEQVMKLKKISFPGLEHTAREKALTKP